MKLEIDWKAKLKSNPTYYEFIESFSFFLSMIERMNDTLKKPSFLIGMHKI